MEFRRYLSLMGTMYFQGAVSNFHPGLLARFGGSLAMCSRDVQHIRIDPASMLGMERRTEDRWTAAHIGWRRHSSQIRALLAAGATPSDAVFTYCRSFGTRPHRPGPLELSVALVAMSNGGNAPRWQVETLDLRRRMARSGEVMSDTFGAVATLGALVLTAEDWQHATPDEWDRALSAGELATVVGSMAGAHADARQQRFDTRESAESAR